MNEGIEHTQCIECECWVLPVTLHGSPALLLPGFYAGYEVNDKSAATQRLVHKAHECSKTDVHAHRRRIEMERAVAPGKSKPFSKANDYEDVAKPYNITCPKCDQDPGRKCLNTRMKRKPQYRPRYNTKPHRERLESGLERQGLALVFDKTLNRYYIRKIT